MNFLRENVTFFEAVNIIHDVVVTPNPYPYTVKFGFVSIKNHKVQQNQTLKNEKNT